MTTNSGIYKPGFNGLLKMKKEMQRIEYQSEAGTSTLQFSTFSFMGCLLPISIIQDLPTKHLQKLF